MKYTPKKVETNLNVSETRPFVAFIRLAVVLCFGFFLVYLAAGALVDAFARYYPEQTEKLISPLALAFLDSKTEDDQKREFVQPIFNKLVDALPPDLQSRKFSLHVSKNSDVNAIALPGGHIVVFSGLLDKVKSENELAMVLAHELGHFANHDHIRGLGRGLTLVLLSIVVFGADSGTTGVVSGSVDFLTKSFSRSQEEQADFFALDLVQAVYGHVGGSTDFFERLEEMEKLPAVFRFSVTHPLSRERVSKLKLRAKQLGYPTKSVALKTF